MSNLSENFQLRKCFLQRDQAPTISLMMKKMSPALANVYFKSMSPQIKVIAGLEPPMKGGGNDWVIPPEELLKGRVVLKPFKKKYLSQWSWKGVDEFGMELVQRHRDEMHQEGQRKIEEHDRNWPIKVQAIRDHEWSKCSAAAKTANNYYLKECINNFELIYGTSVTKLQNLLLEAAANKIKSERERTHREMQVRYERLLRQQAIELSDKYTRKLTKAKQRLKKVFRRELEIVRNKHAGNLHDVNLEKHVVVEKLRHFLKCQTLACQAYVAMKEKQECAKETNLIVLDHKKKMNKMTANIASKDFDILLAQKKELKQLEYEAIWKKKICHVVKTFQEFVSFSLNNLPEHADFFINMEKLLMLQLSEVQENPKADSIIIADSDKAETPMAEPHPFYLFCDKGFKPKPNQDLCPKHCTSSASHLPVIVVNNRCIYSACDNFEQFTDKIKDYIQDKLEEDVDFRDYSLDVPVNCAASQQLQELKLESSIMQVLQNEIKNVRDVPVVCETCEIPHCFNCDCSISSEPTITAKEINQLRSSVGKNAKTQPQPPSIYGGVTIKSRKTELKYKRQPKLESYARYVKPKKCDCAKLAKKHLFDNLPVYMRKMSVYAEPELLNYKKCPVITLKSLVKEARGEVTPPAPPLPTESKTKEISIQCSVELDNLCTCFSDYGILDYLNSAIDVRCLISDLSSAEQQFNVVAPHSMSSTCLTKRKESFATDRAHSLRRLIDQSPQIREFFM